MTVKAVYERGVFRPVVPVHLKEATEVEVLLPEGTSEEGEDPSAWNAAERFIGFIKNAPQGEPIAEEHDRHLYT
jgi:predicted DNA-binding antitoxin AbrB/MazE fold protein